MPRDRAGSGGDPPRRRRTPSRAIKQAVIDAAGGDDALADDDPRRLGAQPDRPARLPRRCRRWRPDRDGRPDRDAHRPISARPAISRSPTAPLEWRGWMREHAHRGALPAAGSRRARRRRRRRHRPHRRPSSRGGTGAVDAAGHHPHRAGGDRAGARPAALELPLRARARLDAARRRRSARRRRRRAGDQSRRSSRRCSSAPTTRATAELRWRNIPLVTRWSPLRKFWQRKNGDVRHRAHQGVARGRSLGTAALVPPGTAPKRSSPSARSLFRRYPATVVYLYPDGRPTWDAARRRPTDLTSAARRPTFTGTIGHGHHLLRFPGAAARRSRTHWVVLEEPPAGYRFYHKPMVAAEPGVPADSRIELRLPTIRGAGARA